MNRYLLLSFTFFVLFVFAAAMGCASMPQESQEKNVEIEDRKFLSFSVRKPPGGYYYYLVAQDLIRKQQMVQAAEYMEKAASEDPGAIQLKQELALVYLQLNKKDEALALCEEILEIHPDNIEALIIAASIRQEKGDIEVARRLYETVIEKSPERKNIYILLGRLYLHEALYEKAEHVFNRLIERYPDMYVGYYYLGVTFQGSGKTDLAIEAFNRSIEIEPDFVEPRFELINIYDAAGNSRRVMDLYEVIVKKEPENISALIELGLLYLKNERKPDAAVIFENLGTMAGENRNVVDTVVQELIITERYEDGLSVIKGMLKALPKDQDLHYLAGISSYLVGSQEDVLFHLKQVGVESRFYADAVIRKASIYNEKKQREEGMRVLASAFENLDDFTMPDKLRVIRFLSAFYIEANQPHNAMDVLQQGIALDPDNTDLYYDLGVAYDKSGDSEKTIEQMRTIIEREPNHADALNYLGYTYAESGTNLDEAEALIQRALEIQPDSGHILDSMGWIYYKKGEIERAVLYLEKAVERKPEDPVILEHLGDAYLKQSRRDEALALYQRALLADDLSNNSDDILKIKKKIETLKKD